jgi:hypothetical protein
VAYFNGEEGIGATAHAVNAKLVGPLMAWNMRMICV